MDNTTAFVFAVLVWFALYCCVTVYRIVRWAWETK